MPFSSEWKDNGRYVKMTGDISLDDIMQADNQLYEDERFETAKFVVWDLTDASRINIFDSAIDLVAAKDVNVSFEKGSLHQIFVCPDEKMSSQIEKYAQYLTKYSEQWQCSLTDSVEDARRLINKLN